MEGQSGFLKKCRSKVIQIPGTHPSIHTKQLLISTGIPSFDTVIGGGLAVGSVLLVEEDTYGNYSKLILKYFLAEAVMTGQSLLVSSADLSPNRILQELPGPLGTKDVSGPPSASGDNLEIAWRYQHLPQHQSSPSAGKFGHYYDLTKTMSPESLNRVDKTLVYVTEGSPTSDSDTTAAIKPAYAKLLLDIKSQISEGGFTTGATTQQRKVLRIGVHSLGSPLWGEDGGASLPHFLYALRALARSAFAVCLVTVPTHLFEDPSLIQRLQHLSDTVVQLDSFVGSPKEKNPAYKEYHGLFNMVKLPRLNSLTCHMPDTLDLAFKLKRKKFMIEKLHLPPELSDTVSRSQEDPVSPPGAIGCGGTTGTSKLDF